MMSVRRLRRERETNRLFQGNRSMLERKLDLNNLEYFSQFSSNAHAHVMQVRWLRRQRLHFSCSSLLACTPGEYNFFIVHPR